MSDLRRWLAVGLIAAIFPSFVCAVGCDLNFTQPDIQLSAPLPFKIRSTDDLEWFAAKNCTEIYGDLDIQPNFTGAFTIPNVKEIWGIISIDGLTEGSQVNLTSIELPNVRFLQGLKLPEIPTLQTISMPNANEIISIQLTQQSSVRPRVDFQSLKKAIWVYLEGTYSSVEFNSLEQVSGTLGLCSASDCRWTDKVELNISFPALRSAGYLDLNGAINSLSLPVLEVANYTGPNMGTWRSGLYLNNYGRPLSLDFPKLRYVGKRLFLRGSISSLSLGSLVTTETEMTIDTNSSLSLNFTTLEKADTINLSGSIHSVEFPALQNVTQVIIETTTELDCHPFQEALLRASADAFSKCNGKTIWANLDPEPEPESKKSSSNSMSPGAKAGLIVGCIVGGLALIAVAVWGWKKMKRSKVPEMLPCSTPTQSQERIRSSVDGPPPPYSTHQSA